MFRFDEGRKELHMKRVIPWEEIRIDPTTYRFQGGEYGGTPISFFLVNTPPGRGPRLHKHPYEEIFVVQEGHGTFTVGENTLEVDGGHVIIAPANVPHKFINSGGGELRQIDIHPSKEVITEWLED
jgi:mannose-6-phosphate isomerase-like protein (cupin superfamily)